jgi:NDP-sugar pyrophosphorylase family protein
MLGFCLAAGAGTRLAPLTWQVPKPLLRPAGRPLVDLACEALSAAGADRVVVNAHHGAAQLAAHLAGRPGVQVAHEPVLLGTGGALAAGRRAGLLGADPDELVLVLAADRLVDPADLADLAAVVARGAAPLAAGLVAAAPGWLRLDGERLARDRRGGWDAAAAYALRAGVLDGLAPRPASLLGALLGPLLDRGALAGRPLRRPTVDAGTLRGLLAASAGLLRGCWPHPLPPGRLLGAEAPAGRPVFLADGATVHPGAVLAGPLLLDAGARVGAGAVLARAVVGPGAEVGAGACLVGGVLGPGARLAPGERAAAALLPGPVAPPPPAR